MFYFVSGLRRGKRKRWQTYGRPKRAKHLYSAKWVYIRATSLASLKCSPVPVATDRAGDLEQIPVPDALAAAAPVAGRLLARRAELLGKKPEPEVLGEFARPRRGNARKGKRNDWRSPSCHLIVVVAV